MALIENRANFNAQEESDPAPVSDPEQSQGPLLQGEELALAQQQLAQLVSLASDLNEDVRRGAQETLRSLPEQECLALLGAPSLAGSVARYFLEPAHLRAALLPVLLSHPDTPQDAITNLAVSAGPDVVPALLDQIDLLKTPALIALKDNSTYLLWQKEPPPQGHVLEVDLLEMLIQEMQVLPGKEEAQEATQELTEEEHKDGIVRKIAKMNVAQRVKLALLGTREERALLIRDSSRVVCRAVLSSPKLSDAEVESFAAMKNVSQDVLRLLSQNRRFMKIYTVLKNLVNNPRLPIDVGLPLLNRLMPNDLRAVANSRDVPDTTRKTAQKIYKARNA